MLNAVDMVQFLAQEQFQMQDVSIDQLIVQTMAGISAGDSQVLAQTESIWQTLLFRSSKGIHRIV